MRKLKKIFVLSHEWNVFIVLLLIVAISLVSWWTVKVHLEKEWTARLAIEVERTVAAIDQDIQGYDQALGDASAFFKINGAPTPQVFKNYVNSTLILKRFPSLQGLAFTKVFRTDYLTDDALALEAQMKKYGYGEFRIWPVEGRQPLSAITLIQPEDWRNSRALGFDMMSDPERRSAMERALSSGKPSMTGALQLLQKDEKDQSISGFLVFNPIYDELTKALDGFVYVIVRSPTFFNGVLGVPNFYEEKVNYTISIQSKSGPNEILLYERFSTSEARIVQSDVFVERQLKVFDQTWIMRFEPLPQFYLWYERYIPVFIAFLTLVMLSVIFLALWSTQQFLKFSEKHKDSLAEGSKNKSLEILLFRKLNNMMTDLSSTIESQSLFDKFFDHLKDMFHVDDCVVYVCERGGMYEKRFQKERDALPDILNLPVEFDELDFNGCVSLRGDDPLAELFLQSLGFDLRADLQRGNFYLMRDALHESGRKTSIMIVIRGPEVICESKLKEYALTSIFSQFVMTYDKVILLRRAEDANFMKSSFLANMSHEIRTPLGVIIGYSEILAHEEMSQGEKAEMVEALKRNGKELARLIDDILDISKVEAGKLRLDFRAVDVDALITELQLVMDIRAKEKGISLEIAKSRQAPEVIETDDIRLKQILVNVVGNAIKFTEKGSVKILYRLGGDEVSPRLEFQVQDTGIGIAEENRSHLFQAFSQADTTTTRKYGGTGLGLALSKRLAELLGGDLYLLESQVGQGSTFCLSLPLRTNSQLAILPSQLAPSSALAEVSAEKKAVDLQTLLSGVRIVLVEDSEDNQEIYSHFLRSSGAQVIIAGDGLTAVETVIKEKPDLVLMDIQIPQIDGKEATRRIRQNGFVSPIIALTAHALQEEVKSVLAAGCNGQITKPVSGEALVREVHFYLNLKGK